MTDRTERRLETLRATLAGRTITDEAPTRPLVTITAVRSVSPDEAVIDYLDHTEPGDPPGTYEIGLADFPDEEDESLADLYLQNLIEDILAAGD